MNKLTDEMDRRVGVRFTLKKRDLQKLDDYIASIQGNLPIGAVIDRQFVLEEVILKFLLEQEIEEAGKNDGLDYD